MFCFYFFLVFFKSIYSQTCSGPDYRVDGTDIAISRPCPPYIAVPYINTTVQFICSYNYSGGLFAPYWNITGFPPISTISASPSSGLSIGIVNSKFTNGRTTADTTLDIAILHFNMIDILNIQCGICSICSQPSFQSAIETTQPVQLIIFGKYILYIIN